MKCGGGAENTENTGNTGNIFRIFNMKGFLVQTIIYSKLKRGEHGKQS